MLLTIYCSLRITVFPEVQLIFIAGASGFVGGHLTDYLLSKGHKLKCLARSEKAKKSLSEKGVVVVPGDITKAETLRGVLDPDDLVIHLVGIMEEKWEATFQGIHIEGTKNLVAEAQRAGVRHFFYQSALGADRSSWSGYLQDKGRGRRSCQAKWFESHHVQAISDHWPMGRFHEKTDRHIKALACHPDPRRRQR